MAPTTASQIIDSFPFIGLEAETADGETPYYQVLPPDDRIKVFPSEVPSPAHPTKPVFYSVPKPTAGSPIILLGQCGDYSTYITNTPSNGHYSKCTDRVPALLGILQHFLTHNPPSSLCLNCYCHHEPRPCPDPPRDFQALINAAAALPNHDRRRYNYKACPECGERHPPTRGTCSA